MSKFLLPFLLVFMSLFSYSQDKEELLFNKFDISLSYGLSFSPEMDYSRESNKNNGVFEPIEEPTGTLLYQKNKIGNSKGLSLSYYLTSKHAVKLSIDQIVNFGRYDTNFVSSSAWVGFQDFRLRESLNFYQLIFQNSFKNRKLNIGAGIYLQKFRAQTIDVLEEANFFKIQEISGSEFGAVFFAEWMVLNNEHIEIGIHTKGFYTMSLATFETLVLSPTVKFKI